MRALLLRGEGRAFCAGRDISGVTPETDDAEAYLGGLVQPLLKKMSAFPAPTFAAAHGACLGVGLGLLLATDVVYVAENAKFGSPFAKLGATLDSGGHWYFTERLGMHRTLDLIYTAELMSGTEAVAQGMFSRPCLRPNSWITPGRLSPRLPPGHGRVHGEQGAGGAHPGPAPGPVGRHGRGKRRAGPALQDGGLRGRLPGFPGEA
ncbi:probable enoyl-CoA hydratase [Arthrobacter sp. Hiyo4]|nr:probable enoyl-CoA hydratase [Arthrobacter sp. Hiyo4]